MGNRLGQSGLWPHAISGDLPIVLARLASPNDLDLAGELLRAHAYWRRCGLVADLVLLNDAEPADELHAPAGGTGAVGSDVRAGGQARRRVHASAPQ